jgi:hypothetical protein
MRRTRRECGNWNSPLILGVFFVSTVAVKGATTIGRRSRLIVGESAISDAIELARQFEQKAFVAGQLGEPARLVWID